MPLTIERRPGETAFLLCSDDGTESVILARFVCEDATEVFQIEQRRAIAAALAAGPPGA